MNLKKVQYLKSTIEDLREWNCNKLADLMAEDLRKELED